MALRVCVLASGSSGNCTFVGSEKTAILIDAGLSGRETARRLGQIGVDLSSIQAVCVSHEHDDHISGLAVLHRRHRIPLYANGGTVERLSQGAAWSGLDWNLFDNGQSFRVGDIAIAPFSVSHDAQDPVGFIVEQNGQRIGVATDIGMSTALVRERLRGCRAVVVEANHDEKLLQNSRRPWHLKKRILSRQGHLSNAAAADMLADIAGPALQQVFLAHLSQECNREELALKTTEGCLRQHGHAAVHVSLTYPDRISEIWAG
jgi:phosphoribosyl 1,2-cyclic phosphodiesterase